MTIEVKTSLGSKIRTWRKLRGLSQSELLAERFSNTYLSKVEHGQMRPSKDFLAYVAARLGLTVEELSTEETLVSPTLRDTSHPEKVSRESQELLLLEARVSLSNNQPQAAKAFLARLVADQLPTFSLANYYAVSGQLELEQKHFDTAILALEQALKLFETEPQVKPLEVEQIRYTVGLTHYQRGNLLLALQEQKRCLRPVEAGVITDPVFLAKLYYTLAEINQALNEREQAFPYYKEAARYAAQSESLNEQAGVAWSSGLAYQERGDLTLAKAYLNKSSILYESIKSLQNASKVKGTLGRILVERGEYEAAEVMLSAALQTALQSEAAETMWSAYSNLAYLYLAQGKLDLAKQSVQLSIERSRRAGNDLLFGQSLAQEAEIRLAQGNTQEALSLFDQAEKLLEKSGDAAQYLSNFYYLYAFTLEKLGEAEAAMRMYRKAFEYQNVSILPGPANSD